MLNKVVFCVLLSFAFLLVATKSSPLYPMNDWVDANAIFTVGKAMANGKVVYKEIFEQKGPLLYAIHAGASLFSKNSFFGVFLMEVLAFSVFLVYVWKIFELFMHKELIPIGVLLCGFLILSHTTFLHGDSAEEYCLPLIAISLFYLAKHVLEEKLLTISFRIILLHGFLAGCVLWIKYSMIGFWFGLALSYGLYQIFRKQYVAVFRFSLIFLAGIFISTIPWLIYFGSTDALKEMFDIYFMTNIKYYAKSQGLIMNLITMSGKIILIYFKENILFTMVLLLGIYGLFFTKRLLLDTYSKIAVLLPFLFLFLSVYSGGVRHDYYFQIFLPLVIFGVIILLRFIGESDLIPYFRHKEWYLTFGLFLLFSFTMYFSHHNRYFMKYDRKDLFQYRFAEYIKKRNSSPSLINYGFLDMGLYHAARIEPQTFYFMKHNFDYGVYPFDVDALNDYVSRGLMDFVLLRKISKDGFIPKERIFNKYKVVLTQNQYYEGEEYTFYLMEKRENR